jgi:hypothetical protein
MKTPPIFGGRVFPHPSFLGRGHVDNSRFFVDKYLALWRSLNWAKDIQNFVPPDIGSGCDSIQDVD